MRRKENPCEWKRIWGFIWWHHVGMIMTILNPKGQPFILTLIIPHNTHSPPLERQQGENVTLKAKNKTIQSHFSSIQTAWLFNIPWNMLHLLAAIISFFYQFFTSIPRRLCHFLSVPPHAHQSFTPFSGPSISLIPSVPLWWIISSQSLSFPSSAVIPPSTAPFYLNILYPS